MADGQDLINLGSKLWATLPPFEHGQKMGTIVLSKYFYPFGLWFPINMTNKALESTSEIWLLFWNISIEVVFWHSFDWRCLLTQLWFEIKGNCQFAFVKCWKNSPWCDKKDNIDWYLQQFTTWFVIKLQSVRFQLLEL